ncbi:MAG TPA: hypothetical protein PKN45_11060 [Candidatus Limiplasma sp.]|nr:hypothetical protein [Candidatus Limiplasma sp.]
MTTQELTHEISEINPKLATHEERLGNLTEKVDAVEAEQKEQRRLLIVIERIATGLDTVKEKVDDISLRVCHIEEKPAKRWDAFVGQVIALLVAAALGFLLSKVGL